MANIAKEITKNTHKTNNKKTETKLHPKQKKTGRNVSENCNSVPT